MGYLTKREQKLVSLLASGEHTQSSLIVLLWPKCERTGREVDRLRQMVCRIRRKGFSIITVQCTGYKLATEQVTVERVKQCAQ
jgi:DNA-binding winged helix-turn-helix (wHTH) protein